MKPTLSEEESNKRMDIIGQNGNDGLHYDDECQIEMFDSDKKGGNNGC